MRILLSILLLVSTSVRAQSVRTDLMDKSHASYFCSTQSKEVNDQKIFDAQVELAFVQTKRPLSDLAKEFARENKHRAYAHGSCADGRTWILSTPAPGPVLNVQPFRLNKTFLKPCRLVEIDAIGHDSPLPFSLTEKELESKKRDDLLSLAITCHPKDKHLGGPELFALMMTGERGEAPKQIAAIRSEAELITWINQLRNPLGLKPLKSDSIFQRLAEEASNFEGLEHPHAFLLAKKKELSKVNRDLIGENRAAGPTLEAMARLFWNSPQHRKLLLNAKADLIGLSLRNVHEEKQVVLILGRANQP